jgi:hypothetical protein
MRTIILLALLAQLPAVPGKPILNSGVTVPAGGNLQAALNAGGVVYLEPGAVYTGNFIIRRCGTELHTDVRVLGRISRDAVVGQLVSGNSGSVLTIHTHTCDVKISRVRFGPATSGDIITVGYADAQQSTLEQQPRRISLDQIIVQGDPIHGAKRGVALQCADCSVTNSYIEEIKRVGQDTQAIAGWNGSGPFHIANNYLQAAGENIMFGGALPVIPDLVPADGVIVDNLLTKDPAWRATPWTVKNLLEFKAGRRFVVRNNILENLAEDDQSGYAIVLTPVGLPTVQVADIRIEDNVVRNVSSGFSILACSQQGPSLQTENITIRNNWFVLSKALYAGHAWFMQLGDGRSTCPGGIKNLVVEHNTIQQDGNQFITGIGQPLSGFAFTRNIVANAGQYGIYIQDALGTRIGGANWQAFFPGGRIEDNAVVGASTALRSNIPTNLFSTTSHVEMGRGVGPFAGYGR